LYTYTNRQAADIIIHHPDINPHSTTTAFFVNALTKVYIVEYTTYQHIIPHSD